MFRTKPFDELPQYFPFMKFVRILPLCDVAMVRLLEVPVCSAESFRNFVAALGNQLAINRK